MHCGYLHFTLLFLVASTTADPNDWVNLDYVKQAAAGKSGGDASGAQNTITSKADGTASKGPWTIINKNIEPPSGDSRDYLSWAPYHWPDCNWCSKGSAHFSNPNASYGNPDDPEDGSGDYYGYPDYNSGDGSRDDYDGPPLENGGVDDPENEDSVGPGRKRSDYFQRSPFNSAHRMKRMQRRAALDALTSDIGTLARRQNGTEPLTSERVFGDVGEVIDALPDPVSIITQIPNGGLPTPLPVANPAQPTTTTSTSDRVVGTGAPAEAPAKTKQNSQCTPSPTKSLAPSATWTTCPYVVRDGKVNPDTNTLVGPDAAQNMSQSVLHNAIAYVLKKTGTYSQNAVSFIDAFFLSSTTGMHPNVNFGQLVRGPGKEHQVGTYTGILDLRGMVKVVNGIELLRNAKAPDWTSSREQAMTTWVKSYVSWLQGSDLGKQCSTKANNHLTFYISQVAATKFYLGDTNGASSSLKGYFSNQFLDQVAQSGEQPFEAVRTRPFHYRCFNLEAMITNAKLGDQLGMNFWTAKSKYGSTIQTAVDYTMSLNPKGEDISDIFPHVAAVAAAYGDPKGKYAAFLQQHQSNYKSQPYYFYDQTQALPRSPAGSKNKRDDNTNDTIPDDGNSTSPTPLAFNDKFPFECPVVFEDALGFELEDGLYVTCDQLRPFYEIPPLPVDTN